MVQFTAERAECAVAPPLAPVEPLIDREHLARMTLGERNLECEVLMLFDRQAVMLLERMKTAAPSAAGALAHTLKGSACGIGAWPVVRAAEVVEGAVEPADQVRLSGAVETLARVVAEARLAIADLLRN
jgi:hypothetical protein